MSNTEISRRSLLQAAAWSIPVLSLAVSAPAYAASTPAGQAELVFDTQPSTYPEVTHWDQSAGNNIVETYRTQLQVRNTWSQSQAVVNVLTITVTYPLSMVKATQPTTSSNLKYTGMTTSESYVTFTFTYNGTLSSSKNTGTLYIYPAAQTGITTKQALQVSVTVTSPQASNTLAQSHQSNTW